MFGGMAAAREGTLPAADIALTLVYQEDGRQAQAQAFSATGERILAQLAPRQGTSS
ncbi:hypothetical protein SODG_006926 [Sodalis praecaptivus]